MWRRPQQLRVRRLSSWGRWVVELREGSNSAIAAFLEASRAVKGLEIARVLRFDGTVVGE